MVHVMSMHTSVDNCLEANRKELKRILDTMDIPEFRKDMSFQSLSWLNRNMWIRNSMHPEFKDANTIVGMLLKHGV